MSCTTAARLHGARHRVNGSVVMVAKFSLMDGHGRIREKTTDSVSVFFFMLGVVMVLLTSTAQQQFHLDLTLL